MKRTATLLFLIALTALAAFAARTDNMTLRDGQQRVSAKGKITVKFVSVLEDSRCPADATCIWAGNAKVKLTLRKGHKAPKTVELNSTLEPDVIVFEGYDIKFVDLAPQPGAKDGRLLTLSITKHKS